MAVRITQGVVQDRGQVARREGCSPPSHWGLSLGTHQTAQGRSGTKAAPRRHRQHRPRCPYPVPSHLTDAGPGKEARRPSIAKLESCADTKPDRLLPRIAPFQRLLLLPGALRAWGGGSVTHTSAACPSCGRASLKAGAWCHAHPPPPSLLHTRPGSSSSPPTWDRMMTFSDMAANQVPAARVPRPSAVLAALKSLSPRLMVSPVQAPAAGPPTVQTKRKLP